MTHIINGKVFAENLRLKIANQVIEFKEKYNITPGLTVVLVGDDAASSIYVRNKEKSAIEAGFNSNTIKLPSTTTENELLKILDNLNNDKDVHGILVQLPLPKHINDDKIVQAILPIKDVDGFHPHNVGLMFSGKKEQALIPCTPYGCLMLLKDYLKDLSGLHAVIIGRSHIVGRPMAELLLSENCTVTIAHSRTKNLAEICKQADILIAAVGKAELVKKDWVKQGVVIIDVGINRIERYGKNMLVGDVDFKDVFDTCAAITPVPGGVGPMTIACLLQNTLKASHLQISQK